MAKVEASVNQIVLPAPKPVVETALSEGIFRPIPINLPQVWAPAWFYSALNWLGKSYYDASNAERRFCSYLLGSDVDPYAKIGSTRLFMISIFRNAYRMSLAADATSAAPLSTGTIYPNTDAGIKQMYLDLAASSIFSAVKYCYIPGWTGSGINPNEGVYNYQCGYDPTTGLRAVVLGSAVSQVVPIADFQKTHNEQIYDDAPVIVPITSALVYDVTQNNTLGATTFNLPVYYAPDQVTSGNYYVNKLGGSGTVGGATVDYGQTAVFPGGPGYNAGSATALKVNTTSTTSWQGETFTTYNCATATVVTTSTLSPSVDTGVASLTYSGSSPSSVFAGQRIIGFYRDASWATCLGAPIYDFGTANGSFTAAATALNPPVLIYNPADGFLNGGTLQNVVRRLASATYLESPDQLLSILDTTIAVKDTSNGVGLSVTTAALDFDLSSTPAAGVVDQLTVPVLASVTTTPAPVVIPVRGTVLTNLAGAAATTPAAAGAAPTTAPVSAATVAEAGTVALAAPAATVAKAVAAAPATPAAPAATATGAAAAAPAAPTATVAAATATVGTAPKPIIGTATGLNLQQIIGSGANTPSTEQPGPVTVQAALTASIPQEALKGTGITSIEIGTAFPQQSLGQGAAFEAMTAGTVLNLMAGSKPALAPFNLVLASTGLGFSAGVYYVLSLEGASLTARGSDGSSSSATLAASANPDTTHTYVGAMVYATGTTSLPLYPLLQLSLPAPTVGTHGVLQGEPYSVRLTFGATNSQYDILDSNQTAVDSSISVPNPTPSDKSTPQTGDLYFGSFIGGATEMTVWSVPVFLTVAPSELPGAAFNGTMTLDAQASGVPNYQLNITDSSLLVFSNINIDNRTVGSVSAANVYLAGAVINSTPDNQTSAAFAPSKLLLGLIRQAQMGTTLEYVFVPEDDSVVIGGTRYMVSVINLGAVSDDPNSRPYPPVWWPQSRYWQFANRHNPYLDVEYTGATQAARISQAQADTARIGLATANAQEPMQMYLDTNPRAMTVWPIYAFPYSTTTESVDQGQLKAITTTIFELLATAFPTQPPAASGAQADEQIVPPGTLLQNNPYTADAATTANPNPTVNNAIITSVAGTTLAGLELTNLSPDLVANTSIQGPQAQASARVLETQQAAANLAVTKSFGPQPEVMQARNAGTSAAVASYARQYQPIFGFSVYSPATGEAYLIEVVGTDLTVPDQLPNPTENATYDPYYVRVVFLNTLTCYNMSIIVPSMVRDQYGNFAQQGTAYQNVLSQTDELPLGYLYSLYDSTHNFDSLTFTPYPATTELAASKSQRYIYTNNPYTTPQTSLFNPISLFGQAASLMVTEEFRARAGFNLSNIHYFPAPAPPIYFVCRRQNWNAECHLMQATQPAGKSVYLAFGGGDLVPFRLDAAFDVDNRLPAHMYKLTYTFADQQYDSAQTISVSNTPYVVAVSTNNGVTKYVNFSINSTAGTADLETSPNQPLAFPDQIYVVGQASATLTSMASINTALGTNFTDTGDFANQATPGSGNPPQLFQLIPYNNLVYLIRAVADVPALGQVGGVGAVSGLLVDTYVPATTGNLALAQGARYKQSGLQFFGSTYTPTTMVDTLDTLDFTSITGETFYAPTIFIPIAELDSTKGFVANISNFLGEQFWTFIYPEITAQPGATVNGVSYAQGFNLDNDGKPILSLQKLHFVYDPLVVMFTPNDLTHAYPLQPKQQVLALANGQVREGVCWRSANVQPQRLPPQNVCAQQILPSGPGMDRPNIVYSKQNRPVETSSEASYLGMSVNSIVSLSGVVYNIEESALASDQTGSSFVSAVSSTQNMLLSVLFDYDNNELGTLTTYDTSLSTKGVVFVNGYLGATGYNFSSPDHFDVNDVLPSQVPWLDEIADILGWDVAFYNIDASLPRQFWSLTYDSFTAPGLANYIPNVPPAPVDPTFSNRTRSLILSLQNPVRPQQVGLMDTYSSVVAANLHLQNGVTGSIFLSKKADRDIASIGSNQTEAGSNPLFGLPTKYDFFIFSRDHYWTLYGASFELIDQGYAMCLVDDGTGTGSKVASYYIDSDGNYNELYTYVLYSPSAGVLESSSFTLKVTLGSPANLSTTPITPETPNYVNPQDLVTQINKVSNLIYAAFGPSSPGQPAAIIPIQAVGPEGVQASPILGPPGFNGYNLNVIGANHQPVQISQIYSANVTYPIAGSTTIVPYNPKSAKSVPFYGSLSHGLDKQVSVALLQSKDLTTFIPRTTVPAGPAAGVYGGDGLGALIASEFSWAFQGSGAIPPAIAANPTPGTTMKADDTVFYTFNAVSNGVMDSTGKSATAAGGQYFIDETDPANPIYGVVALPKFILNGNTCTVNLSTTLSDGVTSRYTLVMGGKSYLFGPDNAHVTADRTTFTFNPLSGGVYTVAYAAVDAPAGNEAPTPISLTPFSITAGGVTLPIDVFNNPGGLKNIVLGVIGRQYTYDPVHATVTVTAGATTTSATLSTGLVFASNSGYGYVVGIANGVYTVNGSPMFPYSASTTGAPAAYPILTAPQMFTLDGNFYVFNQDGSGNYLSVTGNGQTYPINPYQFSINGTVYITNTNTQPYTVVGGGNTYPMTANNTQFVINGVQYTITLKAGSLNGATISGQFNITQGNVVVVENYVYELDVANGQIVGNGTAYPLTTSGFTYTITTANQSFTVTTEPNATTVTIGNILYLINNTTVVGDEVTYPILVYRTFVDGGTTFNIGLDGTVSVAPPFALTGSAPYTRATFTDGATYTVNDIAAFDGAKYYLISGTPPQFTAGALTYQLRTDGVAISAGPAKTYITTSGPLSPNQFTFGTLTLYFGRPTDVAAFDGTHYFAIVNNQFTDTNTGNTYTLSGNTAVHAGNSYEIYSNLGQGPYFEVPGGPTYYVNVAVADTGTPSGTIYNVFPVTSGQFTIPLVYTLTVSGSTVTVNASTYTGGATAVSTLTAAGGLLTGGYFKDPVTNIVYTCVVDAGVVTFIDSNNAVYAYPAPGSSNTFVAAVVVATGVSLAVDSEATPAVYPILNNQFEVGTTTYTVNVPVAYQNAASGPYWPMINSRFIVPKTAPISSLAYTVKGGSVIKGYVISNDDEFSADGNVVYTVNAVNVVKATNQATLGGTAPNQTITAGSLTYTLNTTTSLASFQPAGLAYNTTSKQFTVSYNGVSVTYTVAGTSVTDSRHPVNTFTATVAGNQLTFTDTVAGATFTFDQSGNNPITAEFAYTNQFFVDVINGTTYYVDTADNRVEVISYLPETTQYAFTPADGNTYLIHYNNVNVVFPVVSGANVNVGVATVGSDTFTIDVDQVAPAGGGAGIPINQNSFDINGDLYTIAGTPKGADYSSCQVAGAGMAAKPFLTANTFKLTDASVTYTLQLDVNNLPASVVANFAVKPSRDLISVNDFVYVVTYNTVSTGSLLGQGQASIAITNSGFTLTNPFDTTKAKFIFDDLNIYDAGSVVGQFTAYLAPTFFLGAATFTLNTTSLVVTDQNKQPYPLLPNPTMFSLNGFNYVIDTNRVPHAIVGNNNVSPLSTDVTVQSGHPIPNSTFTLNGQIYAYVEDSLENLLAITGTKSYMIAQPGLTFKLDSSLVFTLSTTAPTAGNYAGTVAPIGTVTAGTLTLNVYGGIPESGNADYFVYKNVMYTLVKSGSTYVAVQKSYSVYAAHPAATQQQLAVFNLGGATYLVTDGTTTGVGTAAGINPGTLWARTSIANLEAQFGLVYGFASPPTSVTQSPLNVFQFQVTSATGTSTLYDIVYTPGSNANVVKVDVPSALPTFKQSWLFNFVESYPLTLETGGYNAFTTFVSETEPPNQSFAGAYRTPVISTDARLDTLLGTQGDFSLEFWHSLSLTPAYDYHPVTYRASSSQPLVYYVDVDFADGSDIYVRINGTVMRTTSTPPVFSSRWRHFGLTYAQPYAILCLGAGYEVKQAGNYNFDRDFSIAMTFAASDVSTLQGLLYKGTGSDVTSPQVSMSYRVAISGGAVTLTLTDGDGNIKGPFAGQPVLEPNQFYQVIVVKHTDTPAGNSGSTDPYAPPFDVSEYAGAAKSGGNATLSGLPTGGGSINISNVAQADNGATPNLTAFLNKLQTQTSSKSYSVTISVRTVNADGSFGGWQSKTSSQPVNDDGGLVVNATGSAHLLIGAAYDDGNTARPLGATGAGNVRDVHLFSTAINPQGINTRTGVTDIASASSDDLMKAGLVGYWEAEYDPNGVVNNTADAAGVAISTNAALSYLAPLAGYEFWGTNLYINGYAMPLALVSSGIPASMPAYSAGSSFLMFNAGVYKLEEISMWTMARPPYQIIDDMFGRLVPSNEPFLVLYLSGSFQVQASSAPVLPMNKYIDNIAVKNLVSSVNLAFSAASLDLVGSPAVGTCGPLVTPNLYTPPGAALTVSDTVPSLTTYSVTLNSVTGTLAGEINEAYVYIRNHVLTLYAGKKVGDLVLTWVSQEQGDVQMLGYIEGAPPCPMANLTNKTSYAGATSVTLSAPTSVTFKYVQSDDSSMETSSEQNFGMGVGFGLDVKMAPVGFGLGLDKKAVVNLTLGYTGTTSSATSNGTGWQNTATNKLDESNKYTVKMQGSLAAYTGDLFMAGLNTLTTPSNTAGNPSSKTAILPNPNLGGFTTSNPPGQLPKTAPTEEKFGQRMYQPSPYGQAFVVSQTLDVYQQTLVQTGTVYGYVRIPNKRIPRDLNIVSFRMSSKYIRPGCLDGVVGYAYNPAMLPSGAQTYTTSTGEMQAVYDGNFSAGEVGQDASYMRVVEAYQIKKQIDLQAYNSLALYQAAYQNNDTLPDNTLTPGLDFYDEYLWSARGGTQEVKHTYTTTYDEVYTTTTVNTNVPSKNTFNAKLTATTLTILNVKCVWTTTTKDTAKYSYNNTATSSFDITASFDGIETDTQMRYACNNDAHFVMNFNSTFNPNNQSGLNLVIGSDGLVYNIVPSPASGAGLPVSDNIDISQTYTQPQPAYTTGNASGLTGNLVPYDRPGKTSLFRTYAFFLQPTQQNADDFWSTVIDPVWLKNSSDPDAAAMRSAQSNNSIPWRLLYRVTYSERFLPPVSTEAVAVPQITPVMAVPVLNPASDFLFQKIGTLPRPAHNPLNDIEANIVLAAPTASGISAGAIPTTGPNAGVPVAPNNVIPFDLIKPPTTLLVNWGDSNNSKLLAQLITSALGLSVVPMSQTVLAGSTLVAQVMDPVEGGPLYSIYTDPNGLTVNVPRNFGITVYQDVNSNPIQYYDGKTYHSLQADYVPSPDGTLMYYIQPPSTYDQTAFSLVGDYDLFGHPGDEWRYYLVSGMSANMTSEPTVTGVGPFLNSTGATPYTGFTIATSQRAKGGSKQVQGYVLVQGILQYPNLSSNAETSADVLVYKSMSLLDTFPIGDPEVLVAFLEAQYPGAPFVANDEINLVLARNIVSYFNSAQQGLIPH
jgi:hypothetical protein